MKIAVVGANGQLGRDVVSTFSRSGHDVFGLTHEQIEIANLDSVVRVLGTMRPELVVNTAAMHHVEKCEAQPELAYAVNALGARNLATVALLGYDGGEVVRRNLADFPLVVHCDYIPRIQEVQASIYHVIREALG